MVAGLSGTPCWGLAAVDPSVTENIYDLFALFLEIHFVFFRRAIVGKRVIAPAVCRCLCARARARASYFFLHILNGL